jgi:hypothetical protein
MTHRTRRQQATINRARAQGAMDRAVAWERSKTFWSAAGAVTLPPLAILAVVLIVVVFVGQRLGI